MSRKFIIKDSTRKRCKIIPVVRGTMEQFRPISLELFSYLWDVPAIEFSIYLRVDDELIQYIRPSELSPELLEHIWKAAQKDDVDIDVFIMSKDFANFQQTLAYVRQQKIKALLQKDPSLDRKTLEVFGDLSGASQMVLRGGLDHLVAAKVKAAACAMVNQLMDNDFAMGTLSRMIHIDPTLYDHSASVAMFASFIAKQHVKPALSTKDVELIAQSGLYHDAGKSCIPHAVLNKAGSFTDVEYGVMKTHVGHGYDALTRAIRDGAPIDEIVARVAYEHHERYLGTGYPLGKSGRFEDDKEKGIHLYSRIVAIADSYSALLMQRVYKPAMPGKEALECMIKSAADFDPLLLVPFADSVKRSLKKLSDLSESNAAKGKIIYVDAGDSAAKKIAESRTQLNQEAVKKIKAS